MNDCVERLSHLLTKAMTFILIYIFSSKDNFSFHTNGIRNRYCHLNREGKGK